MPLQPLFSAEYLRSHWAVDYQTWHESEEDRSLLERLQQWRRRDQSLSETQVEGQFIDRFFKQLWGYWGTGERHDNEGYCLAAQYAVERAGQTGGSGRADLALGWFGIQHRPDPPQVLCEFKGVGADLDAPQPRKGNRRSPVTQSFDYLRHASDSADPLATVRPTWALVTDMNEFRLYERVTGHGFCQRFFIEAPPESDARSLLDPAASWERFAFVRMLSRDLLLSRDGPSQLAMLLHGQWMRERDLERNFYGEYQRYRRHLFETLRETNASAGYTPRTLVRLTQRFLDRFIFLLFCEDMGAELAFPPNIVRDVLRKASVDPDYDPDDETLWTTRFRKLFRLLRDGGEYSVLGHRHDIFPFNGGLFREDPALEDLHVPNRVFCMPGQGGSADAMRRHPRTLLYFSAVYNFGARGAAEERTIGLMTLGRIFEQSITELAYMEAEAEGTTSLAELTRRKRDGVYYTPERITAYVVEETVGARLREIREGLGLEDADPLSPDALEAYQRASAYHRGRRTVGLQHAPVVDRLKAWTAYRDRLDALKVLDPACGSGAFLIQTLRFLLEQRQQVEDEIERITGQESLFDHYALVSRTLANNLYGVDINPESVEITKLALWLHTAVPRRKLTSLAGNVHCGNSLVGPDYRRFLQKRDGVLFEDLDARVREDVNVFDWKETFPEVWEQGGFDCVVGNPPYVKLQHFRKVLGPVAEYLTEAQGEDGAPRYRSTRTGNFDLYLPFVERGLELLNPTGRLGYIAPNVWLKNEYGRGLRELVTEGRTLERWLDFGDHQIFEEAITYTALQFYTAQPNAELRFERALDGQVAGIEWADSHAVP